MCSHSVAFFAAPRLGAGRGSQWEARRCRPAENGRQVGMARWGVSPNFGYVTASKPKHPYARDI
jgi:hypothetical protein